MKPFKRFWDWRILIFPILPTVQSSTSGKKGVRGQKPKRGKAATEFLRTDALAKTPQQTLFNLPLTIVPLSGKKYTLAALVEIDLNPVSCLIANRMAHARLIYTLVEDFNE